MRVTCFIVIGLWSSILAADALGGDPAKAHELLPKIMRHYQLLKKKIIDLDELFKKAKDIGYAAAAGEVDQVAQEKKIDEVKSELEGEFSQFIHPHGASSSSSDVTPSGNSVDDAPVLAHHQALSDRIKELRGMMKAAGRQRGTLLLPVGSQAPMSDALTALNTMQEDRKEKMLNQTPVDNPNVKDKEKKEKADREAKARQKLTMQNKLREFRMRSRFRSGPRIHRVGEIIPPVEQDRVAQGYHSVKRSLFRKRRSAARRVNRRSKRAFSGLYLQRQRGPLRKPF